VSAAPEFGDGGADPLDRWSRRVIGGLAAHVGGRALFPFGGPPWHPFLRWAQRSGRAFVAPVGLVVHDRMGLWASWRGAIALPVAPAETAVANPCGTCSAQPCRTACPVAALAAGSYDLAACHGFLDTIPGRACMDQGCAARRACPLSLAYGRLAEESAHHMRHFHQ
jgi:hypothetical protein